MSTDQTSPSLPSLITREEATSEQALAAVAAVLAAARAQGLAVACVVTDPGGRILASARLNHAPFQCHTIALHKAKTAVGFALPTVQWSERLAGKAHALTGLNGVEDFIPVGGGVPALHNGRPVAAIGVSGASEEQDCDLAALGVSKLLS